MKHAPCSFVPDNIAKCGIPSFAVFFGFFLDLQEERSVFCEVYEGNNTYNGKHPYDSAGTQTVAIADVMRQL